MTAPTAPACIALAGPTASGKTAAALAAAASLARTQPVEIISVDSALIYRDMDIGSAKPSAAERAAVPHHLIDTLDPTQSYSAAAFVADAVRLVGEIRARGALPLLVGGTMLYFKALMEGLDAMPAADAEVRTQIDAEAERLGWPAMHARLAEVDPPTAARLAPHDSQRIQRALEVWMTSGQPLSHFHQRAQAPRPALNLHLISLEPSDRAWLHARVAQRFDAMLDAGFLDEVRALRARGDLDLGLPSMRCVGYRQAWEMFDALEAQGGRAPDAAALATLRERGMAATRQLAKRQITWLRGMPMRQIIAADASDALVQAVAAVHAARTEQQAQQAQQT